VEESVRFFFASSGEEWPLLEYPTAVATRETAVGGAGGLAPLVAALAALLLLGGTAGATILRRQR
jgi:hypothetical protein